MNIPKHGKVADALLSSSVLDKAVAELYHSVFQAVFGHFAGVKGICYVVCSEEAGGRGHSDAHIPLGGAGDEVMRSGRLHGCVEVTGISQKTDHLDIGVLVESSFLGLDETGRDEHVVCDLVFLQRAHVAFGDLHVDGVVA